MDDDVFSKHPIVDSLGRTQQAIFINESGLYSLILSSKLDSAKRFKHWVTNDALKQGTPNADGKSKESSRIVG